jgi:hypothetical protein
VSAERLSLTRQGHIRNALKTPYRDGATHVVFEPLDFMARLVALVPNPRVNLTRFHEVHPCNSSLRGSLWLCKSAVLPICHGVLAPNSTCARRRHRASVAVARTGREVSADHVAMTWAQRLKRVFKIDIET